MMGDRVDSDVFRWAVGGLLGVLSSFGAYWLTALTTRVDDLSKAFYDRGQRITALETSAVHTAHQLQRIEDKLDAALDRKREGAR